MLSSSELIHYKYNSDFWMRQYLNVTDGSLLVTHTHTPSIPLLGYTFGTITTKKKIYVPPRVCLKWGFFHRIRT